MSRRCSLVRKGDSLSRLEAARRASRVRKGSTTHHFQMGSRAILVELIEGRRIMFRAGQPYRRPDPLD